MEPKPVITYFGEVELLNAVLQKKLQSRLKQLQLATPVKEDPPYSAFSSLCSGVEFVPLTDVSTSPQPPYSQPALHTFWTSCADISRYRSHDSPLIDQWLSKCKTGDVECLVVYCVTAEVRANKRTRTKVEDKIKLDFKTKADDVIIFRLSASEDSRLVESYSTFMTKINSMCLSNFNRVIDREVGLIAKQQGKRNNPALFYSDVFIRKLDLAVCYEMTLQNERALQLYSEAITDLEAALSMFISAQKPPNWLTKICHAPCTSWDYPKLVWSQFSWRYLREVRKCASPLLHVRTFFLARIAHLLFQLERAWTVSELVISTLHCMAREIKMLKLSFPSGAFDCWAYMTCNEAIQAFMALISPDSLESATSSLLLVRAEIWHYALQKLESIGVLCGVMPSSNKLNHDKVLIKHITSGIHPVPVDSIPRDVIGIEDQGRKLIEILNDRQGFQTEYLRLGEMVIGAFKYAGRRRMAFKVGTVIAQFHRDLGLVHEAEELLSDICKFYSEDQWTQLSTNAFSLLADCQLKLKLEDKYVNTMLLLASLPPYPGAAHDPTKWLTLLKRIADRSPYQKILNWEPLLQLSKVTVLDEKRSFTVGDSISIQLILNYLGPTDINSLIATIELRSGSTPLSPSTPSTPPQPMSSPLFRHTSSPTHSISSLANMEDLDLSDVDSLPRSRPIGGEGKHRTTTQLIMHISSAEIAELADGDECGRGMAPDMLIKRGVVIIPGENKIVVSGKVKKPGECFPRKISLKWGCLDFVHTVTEIDSSLALTVHPHKVNMDILLQPEFGVFLAGYPHDCHMSVHAGTDTVVPENAVIRIDAGSGASCVLHNCDMVEISSGIGYKLPAMSPDQSHDCHMTFCVDPLDMDDLGTLDNEADLIVWKHEVTVYCEWLAPVHIATLPLTVYNPFSVTCREHSAGDNTFLQLILLNSCPLPLSIRDPMLAADLELSSLHSNLPDMLYPCETFSFLWLVRPATPDIKEMAKGVFQLRYQPYLHDYQQEDYKPFKYNFKLSNMQTVYEVRAYVDPLKEHDSLVVKRLATLSYKVRNVSSDKKSSLTNKLNYCIAADRTKWTVRDPTEGVVNSPRGGETIEITVRVSPNEVGVLPIPVLTLSAVNQEEADSAETKGLTEKLVPLTGAQVYNLSYGQVVSISPLKLS